MIILNHKNFRIELTSTSAWYVKPVINTVKESFAKHKHKGIDYSGELISSVNWFVPIEIWFFWLKLRLKIVLISDRISGPEALRKDFDALTIKEQMMKNYQDKIFF